ncbi:helix-turn-helix domain-containing protein [Bosea sp. 2YAB26]|uniref:helix-turn-helix domain-containing protein n=1 Tax=Bosea sp. 2YAB26 TaxID=3237478 RepID=UPI003F8F0323
MRQARGATAPVAAEELVLSTDMVEPDLRSDLWREISRPFFETTAHPDDRGAVLEGSIRSRALGALLIGPTSFNQQQYSRDRRTILQGGLDQYFVQLFVAGTLEADCEGEAISVGPGDICVFDLARTFRSRVRTGSTLSLVLPRERVDRVAGGRNLHGLVLRTGDPITRLLSDFIVSLSHVSPVMSDDDLRAIEESAIFLIASGLARHAPGIALQDPVLGNVLRQRILAFIEANLSDPGLNPAVLTSRFRVSRAHLYRMFAGDGGVATIIREKRLDASFRELASPAAPSRSITQIAHEQGFSNSAQFHRAFRARFGMAPGEARDAAAARPFADQRLQHVQVHFDQYAQQLGAGPLPK